MIRIRLYMLQLYMYRILHSFRMAEQQASTAWPKPSRQSPEHTKVLICSQRVPSIARGTFPHHSMLKQGRGFSSAFFLSVLLGLRSPILSRRTDKMLSCPFAKPLRHRPLAPAANLREKSRGIQNREMVGPQGWRGQRRRE